MEDDKIEKTRKLLTTIFPITYAKISNKQSNPGQGNSELSAEVQAKYADIMQRYQKGNSANADDNPPNNQVDEAEEVEENIVDSAYGGALENKTEKNEEHDETTETGKITSELTNPPAVNSGQPERTAQQKVIDAAPRRSRDLYAVDRRRRSFQKEEEIINSDSIGGIADHSSETDNTEAMERKNYLIPSSVDECDEWTTYLGQTARNRPVVQAYPGKLLNDKEKAEALGDSSFKFPDKPVEVYSYKESDDPDDPTGNIATNCIEEMDEALETAL